MPRRPVLSCLLTASIALLAAHCGSTATATPDAAKPGEDAGKHADAAKSGGDASKTGDAATKEDGPKHPACTLATPMTHRAAATTCSTTRPPSQPGDASAPDGGHEFGCMYDSQCTDGTNGRCMPLGQIVGCSYDECSTDTDCGANKLCVCGTGTGAGGRTGNTCLPSNCEVDSDCGTGGYCSPTYDTTCGAYNGVVGFFCHRAADECGPDTCVNDSDCTQRDGGVTQGGPGYCAWDPNASAWSCFYSFCAG
jgi:hypothetical protein